MLKLCSIYQLPDKLSANAFSRVKFSTHHGQKALSQEVQLKVIQKHLRVFENWTYLDENCLWVFYSLNGRAKQVLLESL